MRPRNQKHTFRSVRAALWLLLCCAVVLLIPFRRAGAQIYTGNAFVGARVTDGAALVTMYKGNINNLLSYRDMSFLTLQVDGKYFSNNAFGGKLGPGGSNLPIDVPLNNAISTKIGDTVESVWTESGFDIVQDVYPVAFSISGVIVVKIKIINHGATGLPAQAQYLLDNMNTDQQYGGGNDNPFLIDRYGYFRNWLNCPPAPMPSFYLGFEYQPSSAKVGTVGIGYISDQYPPRPLGLTPVSFLQFGDWRDQVDYTWGPPKISNQFGDEAALIIGQSGLSAHPYAVGAYDSVTELLRIAYGTPEWCYVQGNIVGFALYPQHLLWNALTRTYTPNPFQVEAFLFNVTPSTAGNVTIRQTVGDPTVPNPIRIVNPKPVGLPKDTTQMQSVGSLAGWDPMSSGGFANVRWTDSAVILPSGCAASFPVDIHFDVTANGIDPPILKTPWDCTITVDCANPDIIPPTFHNSFAGCDSIIYDTVTVKDNGGFDLGLKDITFASTDLKVSDFAVSITPPPPYGCIKTPVKIIVTQVDTFKGGHVNFTFRDCADNLSYDTVCFTAHKPLPDLTAPLFWLDSTVADCHAQCRKIDVTDTVTSLTSIDRGVASIDTVSNTNMTVSGVPSGGKYPPNTPTVTIHVCVTDSMFDGTVVLRAMDTARNVRLDTITYCTTPDTHAPVITNDAIDASNNYAVHVKDNTAWDRGIDSVWVDQLGNMVTVPSPIPNPIGCKTTYDFALHVIDPTKCAKATIHARDCAGNLAALVTISLSKITKPVIVALPAKTLLCTSTDSITLVANGSFATYLWSTGETTKQIVVKKAGPYSVTGDDGQGCSAPSAIFDITFSPATPVIAPPGPLTMCAPQDTLLDAGVGYASYQWYKDGALLSGQTSQTYRAGASGAYTALVTNSAGCQGTSAAVTVVVNPLPVQPVITSANNILTSTQAKLYQWSLDGKVIPGATNQSYTPQTGGTFTVTITDANGCSSTSAPLSNAGSTLVAVPAMVLANESNHVTIPLSIITSVSLPQGINRQFTAVLRFNKTLLVPDAGSYTSAVVQGDEVVVTYNGSSTSTLGILENLPFTAALGDDSCTTVIIDSFYWSTPNITVTKRNGNFCLSGLCKQGGTRLISPEAKVTMSAAIPNPTRYSIQINYKLIEHGPTSLTVCDLLGHEVLRLLDSDQEPGTYSVSADVSSLPPGTYVYSLRTPTIVKSNHLQIVR